MTTLCHGPEAAEAAEATARAVFEQGGVGEDLAAVGVSAEALGAGMSVTHLLAATGIVRSGKEAKRLVGERGLRFNNELVLDPNASVTRETIGAELKVSVGKKKHYLVRLEG